MPVTFYQNGKAVYVRIPGDPHTVVDRAMRDEDKRRFKAQWLAFEESLKPMKPAKKRGKANA